MSRLWARVRASKLSHTLLALLAAVLTAGVTIAITDQGVDIHLPLPHVVAIHDQPTVIPVDGPDKDAKADDPVELGPTDQAVALVLQVGADAGTNDLVADEPGARPLAGTVTGPVAQLQPPFASDTLPGCRTRTLPTNWSYRAPGTQVLAFAFHYTAGPDIPGSRSDVDGLSAFGSNPSAAVSWHINMDKDGNCDYNVPLRYKAWTIGNLNSETVNMEVAGRGEQPYLRDGGYRELARIFMEVHRRYPAITLRLASFENCRVRQPGIGTHWMGGSCSGGHVDIKPLDIAAVIAQLQKYVALLTCDAACKQAKRATSLREKHRRTHQRFVKNDCAHGNKKHPGEPRTNPYCVTLRHRNKAVHIAAKREHINLEGTYQ